MLPGAGLVRKPSKGAPQPCLGCWALQLFLLKGDENLLRTQWLQLTSPQVTQPHWQEKLPFLCRLFRAIQVGTGEPGLEREPGTD